VSGGKIAPRYIFDVSMTLNRVGFVLALLAVFCVLAVFLCHSMQGPYSAVHGPVTALLSVRAASGVRMAIVHVATNMLQFSPAASLVSMPFLAAQLTGPQPPISVAVPFLALRC